MGGFAPAEARGVGLEHGRTKQTRMESFLLAEGSKQPICHHRGQNRIVFSGGRAHNHPP
jgi:hypothetical protein